jgi:hypothetical protein
LKDAFLSNESFLTEEEDLSRYWEKESISLFCLKENPNYRKMLMKNNVHANLILKEGKLVLASGKIDLALKLGLWAFLDFPENELCHEFLIQVWNFLPKSKLISLLLFYQPPKGKDLLPKHRQIAFWLANSLMERMEWKEAESWLQIAQEGRPPLETWMNAKIYELKFLINWFLYSKFNHATALSSSDLNPIQTTTRLTCLVAHCKALTGKVSEAKRLLEYIQYEKLDPISAYFYLKTNIFMKSNSFSDKILSELRDYLNTHPYSPLEQKLLEEIYILVSSHRELKGSHTSLVS